MSFPLDPARTSPFILGSPSAKSAVLILHGFTGSPWEVQPLGEALAARGHFVHGPRLPGHGTTPEAMLWVSWREWIDAATGALLELKRFERVSVAGLSMGGLLGLILAARHPEVVHKLVLMAPVVKLRSMGGRALKVLRHQRWLGLRERWISKTTTDIEDDEARRAAPLLERFPLARLLDLFTLQDLAELSLPLVRAPALVVAARHDQVVDFGGVERLHERLAGSQFLVLGRGHHIAPRDLDRAWLFTEVSAFLE